MYLYPNAPPWGVQMTSVQPLLSPDDCFEAEAIAKRDVKVQEALAARYGITDPETQVALLMAT